MNFLEISPYVFNTNLSWYSVFVLVGALVCYALCEFFYRRDPESKKNPDLVLTTFLIAFPSGLIGARIWFVLSEWEFYMSDPISILKVWEGGLAIQGGVLLGAAVGIWYASHQLRKHGMNLKITTLMDMIIPNILIAQVIGRWGNFFNREVYGACVDSDTLWFLPAFIKDYMRGGYVAEQYVACPANQYAQPLFLYEGLLNLLGFILISIVLRKFFKKRVDGTLTAFYLIWYGTVRAVLEGYRNEIFIMRWGNISQSVVTSIAFVVLGVAFLLYLYISNARKKKLVAGKVENSDGQKVVEKEEAAKDNEVIKELNEEKTAVVSDTSKDLSGEQKESSPAKKETVAPISKKAATRTASKKAGSSTKKSGKTNAKKVSTRTAQKATEKNATSKARTNTTTHKAAGSTGSKRTSASTTRKVENKKPASKSTTSRAKASTTKNKIASASSKKASTSATRKVASKKPVNKSTASKAKASTTKSRVASATSSKKTSANTTRKVASKRTVAKSGENKTNTRRRNNATKTAKRTTRATSRKVVAKDTNRNTHE